MKELVVISGKGGTGKTSIVASFAALAGGSVVLADCDVDAADLHLVLQPNIIESHEFEGGEKALLDRDDCIACGECLKLCRFKAVYTSGDRPKLEYHIDPLACEGCGVCARFCPKQAIEMVRESGGDWFVSETRLGPLVHARLAPGGENSGKLVTLVRKRAGEIARELGAGLIITDGSPGIGCPVIASVTGADFVLIVTEPTPSGLHDMERAARLIAHFSIPAAVCVNRRDINPQQATAIETSAESAGLTVLGGIDYDPAVTSAQMVGLSLVEHSDGRAARQLSALWDGVADMLLPERTAGGKPVLNARKESIQ